MKKTIYSTVVLLCCTMFFYITVYAAGAGSANVKFGKPDQNSDCSGKGVCMLSMSSGAGMIPASITYVDDMGDGFSTLTIQFRIIDLERENSNYLYQYFLTSKGKARTGGYSFDAPYTFNDPEVCSYIGIEPGTVTISPTNTSFIEKLFETEIRVTYRIPTGG